MANPVGRPPKFKEPEDMQRVIDLYFLVCRAHQKDEPSLLLDLSDEDIAFVDSIDDVFPTVAGLAYTLDMSRQALCDYKNKDEFLDTIKKARLRIEMSLEQRLAMPACTGTIFNLKNNFGWKDKVETEHTGNLAITQMLDTISANKDGLPTPSGS